MIRRLPPFIAVILLAAALSGCATIKKTFSMDTRTEPAPAPKADVLDEAQPECDCSEVAEAKQAAADKQKRTERDRPLSVVSSEVSFESRGDTLAGVISRPEEITEPLPAVVILHDAGPHDRRGVFDGALGLDLPVEVAVYQELADNLAQNGYVVLRFDKRTCVEGGPPWCSYPREFVETHREELASALLADAKAAVALARKQDQVDPTRVFVLGHGQGAELALSIAEDVDASGMILLAPSPYPIDEVIEHQTDLSVTHLRQRRKAEGNTTMGTLLQEQLDALIVTQKKQKEVLGKLRDGTIEQDDALGAPTKTWQGLFELHDRAMAGLKGTRTPVLAVLGEHDLSLPHDSAKKIQAKLGRAAHAEVMLLPKVSHVMVAVGAEDDEPTQVSEDVHQAILHFLEQLEAPDDEPSS